MFLSGNSRIPNQQKISCKDLDDAQVLAHVVALLAGGEEL